MGWWEAANVEESTSSWDLYARPIGGFMMLVLSFCTLVAYTSMGESFAIPGVVAACVVFYILERVFWPKETQRVTENEDGSHNIEFLPRSPVPPIVGVLVLVGIYAAPFVLRGPNHLGPLGLAAVLFPILALAIKKSFDLAIKWQDRRTHALVQAPSETLAAGISQGLIYGFAWGAALSLLFFVSDRDAPGAQIGVLLGAPALMLALNLALWPISAIADYFGDKPSAQPNPSKKPKNTVDGILTREVAQERLRAARSANPGQLLTWAWESIPYTLATSHFLAAGSTGSGKTLAINTLLGSAIKAVYGKKGLGRGRFIIYDPKREQLPFLGRFFKDVSACNILNPFDQRSARWAIAKDIKNDADAQALAEQLLPIEGKEPFFARGAQKCFTAVIKGLQRAAPEQWTLRHALLIACDPALFERFVDQFPDFAGPLQEYREAPKMYVSIRAEMTGRLEPFIPIAAAWTHTGENWFSIEGFFERPTGVCVLGSHPQYDHQLGALNRLIFRRLVERLLMEHDTSDDYTWFFLDEFRTIGELPFAYKLLDEGRSKGAAVVLGFQDIRGLYDVYNENVAEEMLGQCAHQAFFRITGRRMAQWASEQFGSPEFIEQSVTENRGKREHDEKKWSLQRSIKEHPKVPPEEFTKLPIPKADDVVGGYFWTPYVGATGTAPSLDQAVIGGGVTDEDKQKNERFRPRPDHELQLQPLTKKELEAFGLTGGKPRRGGGGNSGGGNKPPPAPKPSPAKPSGKKSILDLDMDV